MWRSKKKKKKKKKDAVAYSNKTILELHPQQRACKCWVVSYNPCHFVKNYSLCMGTCIVVESKLDVGFCRATTKETKEQEQQGFGQSNGRPHVEKKMKVKFSLDV